MPTVPKSIDATGATDVTAAMTSFFASLPSGTVTKPVVVDVPCYSRYRMDTTLTLYDRHHININGNEATFLTTGPGERTRANVRLRSCSWLNIDRLHIAGANPHAGIGDNATVPAYEAQHGFDLTVVRDTHFTDCSVADVYGDFVCMSGNSRRILLERFVGARNGRQGISVTNATDITVVDSALDQVRFSMFDFEPNVPTDVVERITVTGTVCGRRVHNWIAARGHPDAAVRHVTFADNVNVGEGMLCDIGRGAPGAPGIPGEGGGGGVGDRSDWRILRNTSDTPTDQREPEGAAMFFEGVTNLTVTDNAQPFNPKLPSQPPMHLARLTNCPPPFNVGGNTIPGAVSDYVVT